jgi:hypothetical protein
MIFFFITHLKIFGLKVILTSKIIEFESVHLTKIIHIYVINNMNAWYTWYKINCNQNIYI